jgi:serine/threonine-protein kinase RsbW
MSGSTGRGRPSEPKPRRAPRGGKAGASAMVTPVKATIPSDFNAGFAIQKLILDAAEKHGFKEKCLFAIKIAVEEALVNAIKHGNKLDPAKHVIIEAFISPEQAAISIEDEGPGFDRGSVPDPLSAENLQKPSGRGILLIESYMSAVSWSHGGRRVHMVKKMGDTGPGCTPVR